MKLPPETVAKQAEILVRVAVLNLGDATVLPEEEIGEQDEFVSILSDELKKLYLVLMSIREEFRKTPEDPNEEWEEAYFSHVIAHSLFQEKCMEAFPEAAKKIDYINKAKRYGSFEVRKGWQLVVLNQPLPTVRLVAN